MPHINIIRTALCTIALVVGTHLYAPPTPGERLTLMLDPAGDAKNAGREIGDCFERGLTLQYCQELKKELEKIMPLRVVLSRIPGESLEPLQNASFANRLNVDAFLSIHFFHAPQEASAIHIFQYCVNPTTDFWAKENKDLAFFPVHQVHKQVINVTKKMGQHLGQTLKIKAPWALTHALQPLPFKPLVGLCAPAISLEINLKQPGDWRHFVTPVAQALADALEKTLSDVAS